MRNRNLKYKVAGESSTLFPPKDSQSRHANHTILDQEIVPTAHQLPLIIDPVTDPPTPEQYLQIHFEHYLKIQYEMNSWRVCGLGKHLQSICTKRKNPKPMV